MPHICLCLKIALHEFFLSQYPPPSLCVTFFLLRRGLWQHCGKTLTKTDVSKCPSQEEKRGVLSRAMQICRVSTQAENTAGMWTARCKRLLRSVNQIRQFFISAALEFCTIGWRSLNFDSSLQYAYAVKKNTLLQLHKPRNTVISLQKSRISPCVKYADAHT